MEHQSSGLVVWGLKLGKDVFFTSENINPQAPEIARTLEDVRGTINMHNTNQLFYSLEFTNRFKVYTIYKTINDWSNRSNAYLAISLYIPFKVRFVQGTIPVLKALLKIYDDNYLDENLRIKRVQERKERFFEVINEFETSSINWSPLRPNKESNIQNANIRYSSEKQLEEFFDNPFLEEFGPYKEIFFLAEGNDKINGVKDLPILKMNTRPLFRKIQIELKDEKNQALRMPYDFSFNNFKVFSSNYTYEVQGNESELIIKVEKLGYKTFSKKYHLDDEALVVGHLVIQLEKRKEASVKVVDAKHYDHLSKAVVRARLNGDKMWTIGQTSNDNGDLILKDIYVDDDVVVRVECEGFEPKEQGFIATENKLITLDKKVGLAAKEASENTNKGFISGTDQAKSEKDFRIENVVEKINSTKKHKSKQPFKLNFLKIAIAGGGVLGIVLLIFLTLSLMKQAKKRNEILATKTALIDSLEAYQTKISTIFQGYAYQLDTAKAKKMYPVQFGELKTQFDKEEAEIKEKHDDFESQIDAFTLENGDISLDSLVLGNSIKDYYSSLIANHPLKIQKVEYLSIQFQRKLAGEQHKQQSEKERQRYRNLATTMCGKNATIARHYSNLVAANSMGFNDGEKNTLIQKFKLIGLMLNLDFQIRTSSDQQTRYNCLRELTMIRDKNSKSLSVEQKNWLYTSINRH